MRRSARTVLCGGCRVIGIPTATEDTGEVRACRAERVLAEPVGPEAFHRIQTVHWHQLPY
jgi:hypothetical protein